MATIERAGIEARNSMSDVMQGPVVDLPVQVGVGSGWSDGWYLAAPFVDGLTHLCLGALGGIRGHVKTNADGSFTAFHGDLQLGTVKDLDKAKAAVETGKRIRQRGDGRKAKAAKAAKGVGNGQPQGTAESAQGVPVAADGAVTTAAACDQPQASGDQQGLPGLGLPLPLPMLPLPAAVGAGAALPAFLTPVPPPVFKLVAVGLTDDLPVLPPVGHVTAGCDPNATVTVNILPALPTEATLVPKPKAEDIITLEALRGFMPADWCDELEAVSIQGFHLKDQELDYKVNYRGSNHRDVPKYYDGPPMIGVEPTVTGLLRQVGLDKVRVPGGLIMLVPGTSAATLNREKLLRAGVTVEVLEACTDPGTPYTSVTFKRDRR